MVMHNRIRIQQECIEHICDILGPDVYESYEGSGHRTRLQQAILETQQKIYPSAKPLTIRRWWNHFIQYGDTPAMADRKEVRRYKRRYTRRTNRGRWTDEHTATLKEIVDDHPEFYLDEIQLTFCLQMQDDWSASYLWTRLIGDVGYSLQVVADRTYDADEQKQKEYLEVLEEHCLHPSELVFIDESQKDRNSSRRRRHWFIRGLSPFCDAYFAGHKAKRYTLLAACDWNGFIWEACETVQQKSSSSDKDASHGTIDGDRFVDWLRTGLLPGLGNYSLGEPRSIVVMDNATIHGHPDVEELINSKGAILIKLPAYSPQFNPIELMFGHYKKQLKRHHDEPWDVAHDIALCSVTPDIARSFFKKSLVPHSQNFPSIKVVEQMEMEMDSNYTIMTSTMTAVVVALAVTL